jgi:hypothetical protein
MDVLIRGLCEQYIDYKLGDREIREARGLVDSIELPVSKDDVLLGFFLGVTSSQLSNFYMTVYNRAPEQDELEYYKEILVRRAPEIIARIINLAPVDEEEIVHETLKDGKDELTFEEPAEIESETEEPITAEIELSPVATIDDSVGSGESMKFSFQSRSVKKSVATVLGIPVKQ